jgi:hypothetical protein
MSPDSPSEEAWTPVFEGGLGLPDGKGHRKGTKFDSASCAAVAGLDLAKLSLVTTSDMSSRGVSDRDKLGLPQAMWPRVCCSTKGCIHIDKWNRIISTKVRVHTQETILDEPDVVRFTYKCVRCVMRDEKVEEAAAFIFIYEHSGTWEYKKRRVERFEEKMVLTVKYLEALDGNGEQSDEGQDRNRGRHVYQLNLSFCKKVSSGVSEFIVLKAKQMRAISMANQEAQIYFEELKTCSDPARVKELMDIIEKTVIIDIPQLSFGGSNEHLNASAYDDEFSSFKGGYFRYYFLCPGGWTANGVSGDRCMTMLSSKKWRQLYPSEAWAPGQRWYCDCGTRFKGGNGVIVEIREGTQYFYMRAPCPDAEILDIRAMAHEKKFGKLTPAELYAKLPVCQPAVTTLVTHQAGGLARFQSHVLFLTLPEFSWDSIFQFASSME